MIDGVNLYLVSENLLQNGLLDSWGGRPSGSLGGSDDFKRGLVLVCQAGLQIQLQQGVIDDLLAGGCTHAVEHILAQKH